MWMPAFRHNYSVTTCGVQCQAERMSSKPESALRSYGCMHTCIYSVRIWLLLVMGLCNLHTSAVEATLQISSTCYEKQTRWYSENTSITTIIQPASGNNSLGWPSPIQNITRFAFSYLSKSKATIKCTYTGSKMNMLRFKQREKEKETISIQINVGNPDQIFHPVWEEMGKGWKLINQILQFLLKLKHFCTFGTDTPPYLSCSIRFTICSQYRRQLLFQQEDLTLSLWTHCLSSLLETNLWRNSYNYFLFL